ncbi:universal stress protein [Sedimentitalea sp. HM32M-2]|uniref:universal stress protein n=1 Tax=Sedimentitalea sp. HM32M-2 TaxID=3351566 RepID=UPI00362ED866
MKPTITNILFATDLSENSTYALRHAASLAQATGAEIHVLHVTEPLSDDARIALQFYVLNKGTREQALEHRSEMVEAILAQRQEQFWAAMDKKDAGIRDQVTSVEVIEGHPAEAILRRAKDLNCDLIVLGAHDHGFTHTFLGTVAKRVLRRADIPTLVVPFKDTGDMTKQS